MNRSMEGNGSPTRPRASTPDCPAWLRRVATFGVTPAAAYIDRILSWASAASRGPQKQRFAGQLFELECPLLRQVDALADEHHEPLGKKWPASISGSSSR